MYKNVFFLEMRLSYNTIIITIVFYLIQLQ